MTSTKPPSVMVQDIVGWPQEVEVALRTALASGAVMRVADSHVQLPDGRVAVRAVMPVPVVPQPSDPHPSPEQFSHETDFVSTESLTSHVASQQARGGLFAWLWRLVAPEPVEGFLAAGEQCQVVTRRHWLLPLRTAARGLAGLPLALSVDLVLHILAHSVWWLQVLLLLGPVGNLLHAAYRVLLWMSDRIVVTDQRLLRLSGVFHRKLQQLPVSRMRMTYTRSLLGRVLNYGTFQVGSASGSGGQQWLIEFVPRPNRVYDEATTAGCRSYR